MVSPKPVTVTPHKIFGKIWLDPARCEGVLRLTLLNSLRYVIIEHVSLLFLFVSTTT